MLARLACQRFWKSSKAFKVLVFQSFERERTFLLCASSIMKSSCATCHWRREKIYDEIVEMRTSLCFVFPGAWCEALQGSTA